MSEALLPPNASSLERVLGGAITRDVPVEIADLWNPDRCPARLLPWLAHAMSVDEWDADWPDARKREIIRDTVQIHRRKGTFNSVCEAVIAFGYGDPVIVEGPDTFLFDGSVIHDGSKIYGEGDNIFFFGGSVYHDGSHLYGGLSHWAEYHVYLRRPITFDQAERLVEILDKVAPARCHLKNLKYQQAANRYDGSWRLDGTYSHGVV